MTPPAPPRRRRGPRVRALLVVLVVGVVTTAAVVLSALAYVLVGWSLRSAVLDDAVADARFNVGVLAQERLGATVEPGDIEASGLADDFERRDLDVFVDLGEGEDFVTGLDVVAATETVSSGFLELVRGGNVAGEWVAVDGTMHLVVGARRPPDGPDFYFLTEAGHIDAALAQLRLVLLGASLVLVFVGGLAGWRVARLAGSLADSVDQLVAARDRERRFVADVSHELRTPVSALVHEASELTQRVDELPDPTRRVVELLDHDVRRLRDLVEELLELSRLDAVGDHSDIEVAEVDLARFLDAVVARSLPQASVRARGGQRVRTDRRRLERIVANLVDNARIHGEGSSVTVTALAEEGILGIEVADRGPGVPQDQVAAMFDRFTKGDTARAQAGSGLGLAIVREHVRALGGSVTAHNRDGGGLAVTVRLPVTVVAEL